MAICFLRASNIPSIPIFRPIQSLVPRGSGDPSSALQNKWGMWGQLQNSAEFPKFGKSKSMPASVVAVVTSHRGLGGDFPLEGCSLPPLEARGQCLGPVAIRRPPLFPHLCQPASRGLCYYFGETHVLRAASQNTPLSPEPLWDTDTGVGPSCSWAASVSCGLTSEKATGLASSSISTARTEPPPLHEQPPSAPWLLAESDPCLQGPGSSCSSRRKAEPSPRPCVCLTCPARSSLELCHSWSRSPSDQAPPSLCRSSSPACRSSPALRGPARFLGAASLGPLPVARGCCPSFLLSS